MKRLDFGRTYGLVIPASRMSLEVYICRLTINRGLLLIIMTIMGVVGGRLD